MVLFAKDILEKDFISVPGDTSAFDAAKLMKDKRHGFVIVSSESWPEGIVTEWDYLSKITSEGRDPAQHQETDLTGNKLQKTFLLGYQLTSLGKDARDSDEVVGLNAGVPEGEFETLEFVLVFSNALR